MRNKKSKNQLFKLSGPLTDALIDDLKLKLKLSSELSVESDISIFDSFDWRLYKSGHLLIKEEAKYSFYNYKKDKVIFEEQSKSRKLPVFSNDFPQGGLNKELSKRLSIRALIKIAVIKNKLKTFRVLNDDEKTVSRLKIQHLGSKKSKLPGQYYIAAEPVRGYSSEFSMVKSILLNLGLDKTDMNPYIEALISNGVLPGSYSSKFKLEIAPDSYSSQALRQILTHLLNTIKVNEHGIRNDIDIEFLHDYRVAVRRARSALSQVKYVFPENITTKLKNDFSKIGKMTNRLRDLDVYLLNKDEYKSMLPEQLRPGIEPVFDRLKKEREAEQRKITSELLSDNYRAIINDAEQSLQNIDLGGNSPKNYDTKTLTFAKKIIWKKYRKVVSSGSLIDDKSPDEKLHELRIECKKLRYLLEFFAALFPPSKINITVTQLKKLQDNLGDFNDYYVQQESLADILKNLKKNDPDYLIITSAIGGLIAILSKRQHETRNEFKRKFEEFTAKDNRELYAKLFKSV